MILIIVCSLSVLLSLAAILLNYYTWKQRKRTSARQLITEPMIKINFNPVNTKWEWSRLNPKTRTWEWLDAEATPEEIEKYKDVLLSEKEGFNILYGRLG